MMAASRESIQAYAPLIVLAVLVVSIGLYDETFFSSSNLLTITADTMTLFLIASGVTFVIMIGGIDLSIQSVASMASCILAVNLPRLGFGAVPLAILGSAAAGFLGGIVSTNRIPSFIATLAVSGVVTSAGYWFSAERSINISAEDSTSQLPPLLQGFKAVPPLLTDINLSVDDRFLYASCWGTGEMRQYDVSDPFSPKLIGSVHIGGIVRRASHPARPGEALNGGPQMVEISRDGRRVYFTNSLYAAWDKQFLPDGIRGWMVKLDVASDGGIQLDPKLFVDFGELRSHQVRLQGGDASSDFYCYP